MFLYKGIKLIEKCSQFFLMLSYSFSRNRFWPAKANLHFKVRVIMLLAFGTIFPIIDYGYYRDQYYSLGLTMDSLHTVYYFMKLPVCITSILLMHIKSREIITFLNTSLKLTAEFEKLTGRKIYYKVLNWWSYILVIFFLFGGAMYLVSMLNDYGKF